MQVKTKNLIEGLSGESKAVEYLKNLGYKIVERNYKNTLGEIDVIAIDKDRYVFIEVKTRSTKIKGVGRDAITSEKMRKIRNTAISYLKYMRVKEFKMRFDLIEITGENIVHIPAVF